MQQMGIWNEGGFGTRPYRFPMLIFYSFSENVFGKARGRRSYFSYISDR